MSMRVLNSTLCECIYLFTSFYMTFFIQVSIKMVIDATEIYALPILYLSQAINKCKLVSGPAKVMEKITKNKHFQI